MTALTSGSQRLQADAVMIKQQRILHGFRAFKASPNKYTGPRASTCGDKERRMKKRRGEEEAEEGEDNDQCSGEPNLNRPET